MYYKNIIIVLTFCLLTSCAFSMQKHEQKLHHIQNETLEVWVERMFSDGKACQIIKKNNGDDVSFAIDYFFGDAENHAIQSLLVTPSGRHLFIVCDKKIVHLCLSIKSYAAMASKKAKKGLDIEWGIVKDCKVYYYQSKILHAALDNNMDLCIREENGTISSLDFMRLWGPAKITIKI